MIWFFIVIDFSVAVEMTGCSSLRACLPKVGSRFLRYSRNDVWGSRNDHGALLNKAHCGNTPQQALKQQNQSPLFKWGATTQKDFFLLYSLANFDKSKKAILETN